jgi:hypothetical protein
MPWSAILKTAPYWGPPALKFLGGLFGAGGEQRRLRTQDQEIQNRMRQYLNFIRQEREGAVRDIAQRTEADIAEASAASRSRMFALGQKSPATYQSFFAPLRGRAASAGTRGILEARQMYSPYAIQGMGEFMGRPLTQGHLNFWDALGGATEIGAGAWENWQLLEQLKEIFGK